MDDRNSLSERLTNDPTRIKTMDSPRPRRNLSNVRLTAKYHYRHMALWIVLTLCFLLALNVYFYEWLAMQLRAASHSPSDPEGYYLLMRPILLVGLAVEFVLFAFGIVALAQVTSHRIAGPYLRIQKVCQEIRDGNIECRLKFRNYDHIEEVEDAFNQMMEALRASRTGSGSGADGKSPRT